MPIECSSLQNGDAERLKEIDAHSVGLNGKRIAFRRTTHDVESPSRMSIADNTDVADANGAHAGKGCTAVLHLFEERPHLRIAVASAGKVEAENQDAVGFKSQWHAVEI